MLLDTEITIMEAGGCIIIMSRMNEGQNTSDLGICCYGRRYRNVESFLKDNAQMDLTDCKGVDALAVAKVTWFA
jgi:hypothetical protein